MKPTRNMEKYIRLNFEIILKSICKNVRNCLELSITWNFYRVLIQILFDKQQMICDIIRIPTTKRIYAIRRHIFSICKNG